MVSFTMEVIIQGTWLEHCKRDGIEPQRVGTAGPGNPQELICSNGSVYNLLIVMKSKVIDFPFFF